MDVKETIGNRPPAHRPPRLAPASALACLFALAALAPAIAGAQPATAASPAKAAASHVLIVVGAPGTPLYARHYADWSKRFDAWLSQRGAKTNMLSGEKAAAEGIKAAIAKVAGQAAPADQFVLVLLGHGGADGALILPGPDLAAKDLAEALAPIKAGSHVVLNFSSSSGAALRFLRQPGRVVITSNSAGQTSDTDFAEFFLLAMESSGGRPASLLDLFNKSSLEHAQWITRQRQTEEGWRVEGRKSLEIFRKLYSGDDVPPSRRLAPGAGEAKEDPTLPLVPDGNVEFWKGRRLVSEHALLEDNGQSEGAAAVGPDGHHALNPQKDSEAGWLAQRTFLGQGGTRP